MHLSYAPISLLVVFSTSLIRSSFAEYGSYKYDLVQNATGRWNSTTNYNSTMNHNGTIFSNGTIVSNSTVNNNSTSNPTTYHSPKPTLPRDSGPSDFFPVTGANSTGSVPIRQEIRDLQKDSTLWTLYILALDMMQYTNQSDMLSWYQIGGIHGEPYVPWDNVQALPGNEQNGYCHHSTVLFPTWHRPYLALFEQIMYDLVQIIAVRYPAGPVQDQYVAAGKNFRIPYWDWAAIPSGGKSILPDVVQDSPGISVDGPAGTQMIANPLYTYQFKPKVDPKAFIYSPYNEQNEVLRYPTNNTASAVSQDALVSRQLDTNAATFRSRLYVLFSAYHNYSTYSNTAWYPDNLDGDYDSIEGIHDQIHALVGSGGHMSVTDYSAFDPLFMLHHANIDRCFAMWQVLNPDSYVEPTASASATFTVTQGEILNSMTNLTPFHDPTGGFWNADSIRNTTTFGYAYPETNTGPGINVTNQVLKAVNNLYGDKTTNGTDGGVQSRDTSTDHREWIVNLKVNKHALNGTFFVHIFLGSFGSNPQDWSWEPNLVGTYAVLDKFNTADAPNKVVTGTVPLTGTLSKLILANKLASLDPDDVEPYLTANLKYRVTLLDDTEVQNVDVPSLAVSVISAPVAQPQTDSQLPVWGQTMVHMNVSATA